MQKISFVIPCYRSAQTLPLVIEEIGNKMRQEALAKRYTHEVILVCDGSPDDTFDVIRRLSEEDEKITGISFARNFGQHAALMAGLRHVSGDIVICLDDDGQTPADECDLLIAEIEKGHDAVYARYDRKQHTGFRNFGSAVNERMTRMMLGKPKELYISSYFAVKRFIADEMVRYENAYPYVIGLLLRATTDIVNVTVHHRQRTSGTSGYTLKKLMALWMNGFTAFSIKPLRIATLTGAFFAVAGFIYGAWTIIKHLFVNPDQPVGWSSTMSVLLFIGGMLMLMLGLIGEYIGRIYVSMNAAPQYVIREIVKKEA